MERYDSLPRVEEDYIIELPTLEITNVTELSDSEIKIEFTNKGDRAIVIINDEIMGVTDLDEIIIGDLDSKSTTEITLVSITDTLRGNGVSTIINNESDILIPKAPNTGQK